MKKLLILALLFFWLGAVDGTMDTVKFHYGASVFKIDNPDTDFQKWWDHWSNTDSWKNRYRDWPTDKRLRLVGHGPFVWLSDFWHFMKTLLVLSFILVVFYAYTIREIYPFNWKFLLLFIGAGWFLYGGVHDLFFELLLKSFWI